MQQPGQQRLERRVIKGQQAHRLATHSAQQPGLGGGLGRLIIEGLRVAFRQDGATGQHNQEVGLPDISFRAAGLRVADEVEGHESVDYDQGQAQGDAQAPSEAGA